jgi:hypothetical protein
MSSSNQQAMSDAEQEQQMMSNVAAGQALTMATTELEYRVELLNR